MKKLIPIILLIFVFSVFGQKDKDKVEVKLNLLVADSNQKFIPIDDIKVEDLKLFEDDAEKKITHFQKKTSAN
nr:hypothetical protein [Pyrinomonadaceae bacterium]